MTILRVETFPELARAGEGRQRRGAQQLEQDERARRSRQRLAPWLGRTDVAQLLSDTLQEEKDADVKLTVIAESFVNEASAEGENDEEYEAATPSCGRRPAPRATMRSGRQAAADTGRSKSGRTRSR